MRCGYFKGLDQTCFFSCIEPDFLPLLGHNSVFGIPDGMDQAKGPSPLPLVYQLALHLHLGILGGYFRGRDEHPFGTVIQKIEMNRGNRNQVHIPIDSTKKCEIGGQGRYVLVEAVVHLDQEFIGHGTFGFLRIIQVIGNLKGESGISPLMVAHRASVDKYFGLLVGPFKMKENLLVPVVGWYVQLAFVPRNAPIISFFIIHDIPGVPSMRNRYLFPNRPSIVGSLSRKIPFMEIPVAVDGMGQSGVYLSVGSDQGENQKKNKTDSSVHGRSVAIQEFQKYKKYYNRLYFYDFLS